MTVFSFFFDPLKALQHVTNLLCRSLLNVHVASVQISCKVSQFIHLYIFGCNYFWMLCEGVYLHTLIVVAVFAEKQHLMWYYLLGWGEFSNKSKLFIYSINCIN